jgi:hypothetical protein
VVDGVTVGIVGSLPRLPAGRMSGMSRFQIWRVVNAMGLAAVLLGWEGVDHIASQQGFLKVAAAAWLLVEVAIMVCRGQYRDESE